MTVEEKKYLTDVLNKAFAYNGIRIVNELEKENAELREQISTLLSCSNCPDNKGGYVCEKEYNDKCLAQKIQYIKELKEEIEKMKSFIHSEIDFCMYCPLTKDCKNDEGTCPYACATREEQKNLLMDFIRKWESEE